MAFNLNTVRNMAQKNKEKASYVKRNDTNTYNSFKNQKEIISFSNTPTSNNFSKLIASVDTQGNISEYFSLCGNKSITLPGIMSRFNGIKIEDGKHTIVMTPVCNNNITIEAKRKFNTNNTLLYNSFNGSDDLEYVINDKGIKENIIVNKQADEYKYSFEFSLNNLQIKEINGKVVFRDSISKEIFYALGDLYLLDSEGNRCENVKVSFENNYSSKAIVDIVADSEWMNSSARKFPVLLDPSIEDYAVDNFSLTYSKINGSSDVEEIVGFKGDSQQELIIKLSPKEIYNSIKTSNVNSFECYLKFELSEKCLPSGYGIQCHTDDDELISFPIREINNNIVIDITKLINEYSECDSKKILIQVSQVVNTYSDTSDEGVVEKKLDTYFVIKDNKINIYSEYSSFDEKEDDEIEYSFKNDGSIYIDGQNGHIRSVFPISEIGIKKFNLPFKLIHINREITNSDEFFPNGLITNFHQKLKSFPVNNLFGVFDYDYYDSTGSVRHFYSKFYYVENNEKIYVDRSKVELKADFTFIYTENNKEVTLETSDDNGNYIYGGSILSLKRNGYFKKNRTFYYKINNNKIVLSENSLGLIKFKFSISKLKSLRNKCVIDLIDKDGFKVNNASESGLDSVEYNIDELNKIDGNYAYEIEVPIKYSKEANSWYIEYYKTYRILKGTKNDSEYDKYLLYPINNPEILFLEEDEKNSDFVNYINDSIYINDDISTLNLKIDQYEKSVESLKQNINSLSKTYSVSVKSYNSSKVYINDVSSYGLLDLYNYSLQNDSNWKNIEDVKKSISEYINNISEYELLLENLYKERNELIDSQRWEPNNYLIDSSGSILCFDYYGYLTGVVDKNNDVINIKYDVDNDTHKILSIMSDKEKIDFVYKNEILNNIIDKTGAVYNIGNDSNGNLIIKKPDGCFIKISSNNEKLTYESELGERYTITKDNNVTSIKKEISNGIISNDGILNNTQYNKILEHSFETNGSNSTYSLDAEFKCYFGYKGELLTRVNQETGAFENYLYNGNNLIEQIINNDENASSYFERSYNDSRTSTVFNFGENQANGNVALSKVKNNSVLLQIVFIKDSTSNITDYNMDINVIVNYQSKVTKSFTFTFEDNRYEYIYIAVPIEQDDLQSLNIAVKNYNTGRNLYISKINLFNLYSYQLNLYDNNGNVVKTYTENNITDYEYNNDNKLIEKSVTDYKNFKTISKLSYDVNGNLIKTIVEDYYNEECLKSSVTENLYDENSNCIKEVSFNLKDPSLKNVDQYDYDDRGNVTSNKGKILDKNNIIKDSHYYYGELSNNLIKEENPNGQTIIYSYDSVSQNMRSISTSVNGTNNVNNIDYKFGLKTKVSHKGFATYFDYDCYGRIVNVKYNDTQMLSKSYVDKFSDDTLGITDGSKTTLIFNNALEKTIFSNKDGNVIKETINGDTNVTLNNIYSDDLLIKTEISSVMNDNKYTETYKYQYDDEDRLISSTKELGTNLVKKIENTYDEFERILSQNLTILDTSYVVNYSYVIPLESLVNTISVLNSNNESVYSVNYEYDALDRVVVNELKFNDNILRNDFTYLTQDENTIDVIVDNIVSLGNNTLNHTSYIYDTGKRIIDISNDDNHTSYEYDNAGRIIRENNEYFNKTITFKYDCNGNVISKKEYEYTLDTELANGTKHSFTYNLFGWSDQLLKYDGKSFQYNEMGNPILYKDLKLTWNKEGTLKSFSNYSYIYDANKVRIIKKCNDDSYKEVYVTDGTKILRRKIFVSNKEKYSFDYLWNVDNLVGFIYNNAKYFFVKNIQGDITHILNQDGESVAKYIYDAFGNHKVLDSEGNIDTNQYSLGNLNPYRYRGYYFDSETGLYYLQSRYYDPELGRFISPDSVEYLDASSINGLNLYAYCLNDPVNKVDPYGNMANWIKWLIGCVTFTGAVILTTLTGGALAPVFIGMGISILSSGIISGIVSCANNGNFWSGFADGAAEGAMWGGIFALGGSVLRTVKMFSNGVAIGENMERIGQLAKTGGQITYKGMPGYKLISKLGGDSLARELSIQHNKRFIERMMKWGVKLVDYGIDVGRNYRSFYYLMETIVSNGYKFLQIMY